MIHAFISPSDLMGDTQFSYLSYTYVCRNNAYEVRWLYSVECIEHSTLCSTSWQHTVCVVLPPSSGWMIGMKEVRVSEWCVRIERKRKQKAALTQSTLKAFLSLPRLRLCLCSAFVGLLFLSIFWRPSENPAAFSSKRSKRGTSNDQRATSWPSATLYLRLKKHLSRRRPSSQRQADPSQRQASRARSSNDVYDKVNTKQKKEPSSSCVCEERKKATNDLQKPKAQFFCVCGFFRCSSFLFRRIKKSYRKQGHPRLIHTSRITNANRESPEISSPPRLILCFISLTLFWRSARALDDTRTYLLYVLSSLRLFMVYRTEEDSISSIGCLLQIGRYQLLFDAALLTDSIHSGKINERTNEWMSQFQWRTFLCVRGTTECAYIRVHVCACTCRRSWRCLFGWTLWELLRQTLKFASLKSLNWMNKNEKSIFYLLTHNILDSYAIANLSTCICTQ